MTLVAALGMFAASAQPLSDIDRYLERADQETRVGEYEAAAAILRAGRHAAAAESATRFLLASDLPVEHNQEVVDLVKAAEAALAHERDAQRAREAAQQAQRVADTAARESRSAGNRNGPQSCEVPGFPYPNDVQSLGLNWCPSNVDFQLRALALQAAGAWCAILGGTSSTPEQIAARHGEIVTVCDRLGSLAGLNLGESCRCPSGYRP